MKLQIKTLSQKCLVIDIEDTKTVYELKKELELYPDVGVKPELQKLIYAGRILSDDTEPLKSFNIDSNKFLVVMILKQPEPVTTTTTTTTIPTSSTASNTAKTEEQSAQARAKKEFKTPPAPPPSAESSAPSTPSTPTANTNATAAAAAAVAAAAAAATTPAAKTEHDLMVENIVSMGYPESEVRVALAASYNNPERAIEYLIEGIPETQAAAAGLEYNASEGDLSVSPIEILRTDPLFRNLRHAVQQHPELLDDAIQRIGDANPGLLNLINENQQEFLAMLLENSDDEEEPEPQQQ